MAKLAIKGHPTKGNEVIEILKMLGGINAIEHCGNNANVAYYIKETYKNWIDTCYPINLDGFIILTLEGFLKKYPYKVGDKVLINDDINDVYTITSMTWDEDRVAYRIEAIDGIDDPHYWFANEMMHYTEQKEETMEGKIESFEILESNCADEVKIEFDPSKFEMVERDNGYYVVKKKPQYPKTYEECCEITNSKLDIHYFYTRKDKEDYPEDVKIMNIVDDLRRLLICRNAYWKIAGEQMGLGKPFEPDWNDEIETYYTISYDGVNIKCYNNTDVYSKLAFPTEEMRDAFYENFKDLIEKCKELL